MMAVFSIYSGANGGILPADNPTAAAAANPGHFRRSPTIHRPDRIWHRASRWPPTAKPISIGRSQRLDYEDEEQQRVSETVAFTLVDFAACDPRCAKYFAKVPRAKWTADLLPVSEFLSREPKV